MICQIQSGDIRNQEVPKGGHTTRRLHRRFPNVRIAMSPNFLTVPVPTADTMGEESLSYLEVHSLNINCRLISQCELL
jgi:hypothetical protein